MFEAAVLGLGVPVALWCVLNGLYYTGYGGWAILRQWRRDEEWNALPASIRAEVAKEMEDLGV